MTQVAMQQHGRRFDPGANADRPEAGEAQLALVVSTVPRVDLDNGIAGVEMRPGIVVSRLEKRSHELWRAVVGVDGQPRVFADSLAFYLKLRNFVRIKGFTEQPVTAITRQGQRCAQHIVQPGGQRYPMVLAHRGGMRIRAIATPAVHAAY